MENITEACNKLQADNRDDDDDDDDVVVDLGATDTTEISITTWLVPLILCNLVCIVLNLFQAFWIYRLKSAEQSAAQTPQANASVVENVAYDSTLTTPANESGSADAAVKIAGQEKETESFGGFTA